MQKSIPYEWTHFILLLLRRPYSMTRGWSYITGKATRVCVTGQTLLLSLCSQYPLKCSVIELLEYCTIPAQTTPTSCTDHTYFGSTWSFEFGCFRSFYKGRSASMCGLCRNSTIFKRFYDRLNQISRRCQQGATWMMTMPTQVHTTCR